MVVLLVGVAGAGYYVWKKDKPAVERAAAIQQQPVAPPPAPAPVAPAASITVIAPPALVLSPPPVAAKSKPSLTLADVAQPAEGTPVRDLLGTLRDAADRGLPQAQCRLGIELIRCSRLRSSLISLGDAQAAAARPAQDPQEGVRLGQRAALLSQKLASDQRMCQDVRPEDTREAWRYVYLAAAAGNVGLARPR